MALVVQSVTRDYGLAILAAALTALNPLLAHYTVFVHQYPFDFLVTALFLLAAAHLLVRNRNACQTHGGSGGWPWEVESPRSFR